MSRPANAALRLDHLRTRERAHLRERFEQFAVHGRLIARQRDHLGDVHALIAHALDVLDRVQQRRHEPQIARHGRLQREQREDALVDLQVATVDAVVVGDHHLRELDVLVLERLEHAVELLDDQIEAAERVLLERLQLRLEVHAPGGALGRRGGLRRVSQRMGRGPLVLGSSRTFR